MVYIKPYDSEVFDNFFVFLKTIEKLDEKYGTGVVVTVGKALYNEFHDSNLKEKYNIKNDLSYFLKMTPEC